MIKSFNNWKVFEGMGNGEETFEDQLDMYGKMKNLDIFRFKDEWGDLEDAKGLIEFKIKVDLKKSGIESLYFYLTKVALALETRIYEEDDDDGQEKTIEIEMTEDMIEIDNVEYEVHNFPLYLTNIELDFSNVKDINDPEELKKLSYTVILGSEKNN